MRHRRPLSSPSPRGHQTLRPAAADESPLTPPSGKNEAYRTTKATIAKPKPAALVKTGQRQANEWFSKLTECADAGLHYLSRVLKKSPFAVAVRWDDRTKLDAVICIGKLRDRLAGDSCCFLQQFGDADEVVGSHREGEDRLGFDTSAHLQLGEAGLRFDPTEHLLDPFAADLADPIACMAGGAAINGGSAHDATLADRAVDGDVRRHQHQHRCCHADPITQGRDAQRPKF